MVIRNSGGDVYNVSLANTQRRREVAVNAAMENSHHGTVDQDRKRRRLEERMIKSTAALAAVLTPPRPLPPVRRIRVITDHSED